MSFAVECQHRLWAGKLKPGDSLLSNHPLFGGVHQVRMPSSAFLSPLRLLHSLI
jgi:5-oxoprolinase (ATP-hydrolysing)